MSLLGTITKAATSEKKLAKTAAEAIVESVPKGSNIVISGSGTTTTVLSKGTKTSVKNVQNAIQNAGGVTNYSVKAVTNADGVVNVAAAKTATQAANTAAAKTAQELLEAGAKATSPLSAVKTTAKVLGGAAAGTGVTYLLAGNVFTDENNNSTIPNEDKQSGNQNTGGDNGDDVFIDKDNSDAQDLFSDIPGLDEVVTFLQDQINALAEAFNELVDFLFGGSDEDGSSGGGSSGGGGYLSTGGGTSTVKPITVIVIGLIIFLVYRYLKNRGTFKKLGKKLGFKTGGKK